METDNRIILHTCCAPCATACIERLLQESHRPELFFSNSNIDSLTEYNKRLAEARQLAGKYSLKFTADPYDHKSWLEAVRGLESEPEKGARCLACFRFSMERTAKQSKDKPFATTLTVSPHKRSQDIFKVGGRFPGFLPMDFKKKNGFRRSLELSEEFNLYRQNYCGCEFSKR